MNNLNQNRSLVDLTSLRDLLGNNDEGVREILTMFVSNIPDSLKEVRNLFESQQWDTLRKKVHSIKSYYGYVGQVALNEKLNAWEGALVEGKGRESEHLVSELETKSSIILQELSEILLTKSIR